MFVRYIGTLQPRSMCRTGTSGLQQGVLEGERAAEQEADQVVAPAAIQVGRLVDQLAVAIDAIARQVGAQVGPRRDQPRLADAGLGHVQQRTRLRIALAEQQEIKGQLARHHHQVGLDECPWPGRRSSPLSSPSVPAGDTSAARCRHVRLVAHRSSPAIASPCVLQRSRVFARTQAIHRRRLLAGHAVDERPAARPYTARICPLALGCRTAPASAADRAADATPAARP